MNIEKGLSKTLSPFSNFLKKNNKIINILLVTLLILILFPVDHFFTSNPVKEVQDIMASMIGNPMSMAFLTLLTYVVYASNDTTMFTLYMFLMHYLVLHSGGSPSPRPSPSPASTPPVPPPAPKKPPVPPPPAPKKPPVPPPAPKKPPVLPPPAPVPPSKLEGFAGYPGAHEHNIPINPN